ncbi:hypothetical protein CMT34_17435 [Elizabethkingia anophelis]|jgi:hypothetical protein|nr:hypothetical protein [Elizabethkingia anophelis]MDV4069975.1 hypothetical protein [Elizabethkingia anophelis]
MTFKIFFIVLLSPLLGLSQSKGANCLEAATIYQSYRDYLNGRPVDSTCLSNKGNNISIFYNKLTLKDGKLKRKYKHGSLWGYKKGNDVFRYYDKASTFGTYGYHKIIDQNGLVIYSKKESGGYRMSSTYTVHFYSKDLDSPLKKLTIKNLKTDFPDPSFIAELEKLKSLTEKDDNAGFEINNIYRKYYRF